MPTAANPSTGTPAAAARSASVSATDVRTSSGPPRVARRTVATIEPSTTAGAPATVAAGTETATARVLVPPMSSPARRRSDTCGLNSSRAGSP